MSPMVVPEPVVTAPAVQALLDAPQRVGVRYRPIADLRGASVRGWTALAHLPEDDGRPVRAWFDDAAAAGAAGVLEAQVVQAAVVARPLLARGRFVAVALSDAALCSVPVRGAFAGETALDHVVVELDGDGLLDDAVIAAVDRLRAAGARVGVDLADGLDAGLLRVAALRPEYVRVGGAGGGELPRVFEALAELAIEHDPWLIAGGVDEDAQLEDVLARGVRFADGDALGRPVPALGELGQAVRARLRYRAPADLGSLAESGLAVGASALALEAATSVRDAARQAMARPPAVRFDPIAVIAADGSHAGVVPIDRLVSALAG